jgi:PhzF family phenazine biosynthesis protein
MIETYFVDAFTTEPFKGNPAGVCILAHDLSNEKMLNIAIEIGFSETAFVKKIEGQDRYSIRYFSPKKEIPLCGHATLAAAKIIFDKTAAAAICFITVENIQLVIKKDGEHIIMEFPVYDNIPFTVPNALLEALGLEEVMNVCYSSKNKIIVLEIADAGLLAVLNPDFTALLNAYENINGVLVTAASNTVQYDFHYRYFWPWAGTNEDPVTGGVQTFLAGYWSARLNKQKMNAFQSSARTGFMIVELRNDKVFIYGKAVTVFEGKLLFD